MKWHGGPFDGAPHNGPDGLVGQMVDAPVRLKVGSRWVSASNRYVWEPDGWHYVQTDFDEWKEGMRDG